VIFFFLATQEKQDPNCQEMKNPRAAVPRYRQRTLELAVEQRNMAVARQTAREHRIIFLSWIVFGAKSHIFLSLISTLV